MKWLLLFLLLCLTSQLHAQGKVKFNGYYYFENKATDSSDQNWNYIRFYKDGSVVDASVDVEPGKLISFLKKNNPNLFQGKYTVKGDKINFSTSGKNTKKIVYAGTIKANTLHLHMHSLITNYEADEDYTFIPIKGVM